MSDRVEIAEAQSSLEGLCEKAATSRERTAIIRSGQALAVLISPEELADLEDELAIAQNRLNEAQGSPDPVATLEELRAEFTEQDAEVHRGVA